MRNLKIAMIGASTQFAKGALNDIALNQRFLEETNVTVHIMDIKQEPLDRTFAYAEGLKKYLNHPMTLLKGLDLEAALKDADFVITAIEVDRYDYWSMDFHIPRNYGSRQIYGENGGPGSMFHTLRNIPPMLHIAKTMEKLCPDAWMINYTNPEAKLIEALQKLTSIKCCGLCHGLDMGIDQVALFLERDREELDVEAGGLNHFGLVTAIHDRKTGEDLYPLFKEKEAKADPLANFDEFGLGRTILHTYGYYGYPGTNHIGEYISWAGDFYLGQHLLYRYDPIREKLWEKGSRTADFIYTANGNILDGGLFKQRISWENEWKYKEEVFDPKEVQGTREYAIPIIQAIFFDEEVKLNSVNTANHGAIKGLPDDMVVETQAIVDGSGITLVPMEVPFPLGFLAMINVQGAIHQLLIDAFVEKSKTKLLHAVLLDPQAPSYYQAAAMIDEMVNRQKNILPELEWK